MVFQYQFWRWARSEALIRGVAFSCLAATFFFAEAVFAVGGDSTSGNEYLRQAITLHSSGQYFKSARYAFAASQQDASVKPNAYAWVTMGLLHAGLPHSAAYFFIRTLQSGNSGAIRSVLSQTQNLLVHVGADLLRKYLIRHTKYEDYDPVNRSAYLYALGKDALVSGDASRALGYLAGVSTSSPLWAFSLQLRGTANAILGKNEDAIRDFEDCASDADRIVGYQGKDATHIRLSEREADDLRSRCVAGKARTLYQMEDFVRADRTYDSLPKKSFVWPDILFEQGWNSFALRQHNRTLGKLVSYKSPALSFMFNTESDVLRAQAYMALCLYSDANQVINEFNAHYTRVGEEVKNFVEGHATNMSSFYALGRAALSDSLYTKNQVHQLANRFVRSPYFQNLVLNEHQISSELNQIRRYDAAQNGVSHRMGEGFPGFLENVLRWRVHTIHLLGGGFVKNSLMDYHAALIDDFEKMAFIKLEMLRLAKDKLIYKNVAGRSSSSDRNRGSEEPSRRDDQYYWSFNGEYWNDELGDHVFGLESECKG